MKAVKNQKGFSEIGREHFSSMGEEVQVRTEEATTVFSAYNRS